MENIYHISEAHPNLLVGEIGMIEDGYHPSGMDDSLLRDLDDSEEKKRIEYRHHQRFQLRQRCVCFDPVHLRRTPENYR